MGLTIGISAQESTGYRPNWISNWTPQHVTEGGLYINCDFIWISGLLHTRKWNSLSLSLSLGGGGPRFAAVTHSLKIRMELKVFSLFAMHHTMWCSV